MFKLAWGRKVDSNFRARLLLICRAFGWSQDHASWLMSCIAFESAETFRADILNAAGSGATGLIQFMPSTARGLKTTVQDLARMTPVQQLDYVEAYFRPYSKRISNLPDMYMAILMPKYVGQPLDTAIFTDGIAYRQNSGLDDDGDGRITKKEAAGKVQAKYEKGMNFASEEVDMYP